MRYTGLNYQGETLLDYHTHIKKIKDRREKQVISRGGYQG
jgi:hypothetical protein